MIENLQDLFYSNIYTEIARWTSLAIGFLLLYKGIKLPNKFFLWLTTCKPSELGSEILNLMDHNPIEFKSNFLIYKKLQIQLAGGSHIGIFTREDAEYKYYWEEVPNTILTSEDLHLIYGKAIEIINILNKKKIRRRIVKI